MSKLSQLEQQTLRSVIYQVRELKKSQQADSDSIEDLVHRQIPLKWVEKNEQEVFEVAVSHFTKMHKALDPISESLELLAEHFELDVSPGAPHRLRR